jgi:hypothetical protein
MSIIWFYKQHDTLTYLTALLCMIRFSHWKQPNRVPKQLYRFIRYCTLLYITFVTRKQFFMRYQIMWIGMMTLYVLSLFYQRNVSRYLLLISYIVCCMGMSRIPFLIYIYDLSMDAIRFLCKYD